MNKLLLTILLLIPVLLMARRREDNTTIQTLLKQLQNAKEDTGKVTILYNLAVNYLETDADQGSKYGEAGLALAEKLDWKKGIVLTANISGDNYIEKSNYPKALDCYFKALKINEQTGYKLSVAATLSKIGDVYDDEGNYSLALESENKILKITQDIQDKKTLGRCNGALGSIYLDIAKNYSGAPNTLISADKKVNLGKSVEYSDKAIKLSGDVGDAEELKMAYKTKYAAQKMMGDVKGALESYGKFMALKHTMLSPRKSKEIERKQLEYEYGKREDSLRAQQLAAEETVKQQTQILTQQKQVVTQQQQQLQLTNKQLSTTERSEEDARLALQQTQTDLTQEKTNAEEQEKKLTLSEQQNAFEAIKLRMQQNEIKMQARILEARKKERYLYIIGIFGMAAFSIFVYRSLRLQKRYNIALVKEKQRSEQLLLNILPFEVAEELMEKGFADAKHFDNVTVLFTDFISFTLAAETMPPKQLVGELHICFKAFDEILSKYHIEKIKTVGDAYLAVSGLPIANPNHAEDIVAAAVEIRDFMQRRKELLGDNTFSVRLGVNSGSVVAGIVGVTKYAYDIWGDAVNIAARMEQCSEDGKINISETTYELIKNKYACKYRGKIEAKNKGNVDMYYLQSEVTKKIPFIALSNQLFE